MFGHPKDIFFTKKARINFEVYGQNRQNYPITPEAGEKRLLFRKTQKNIWEVHVIRTCWLNCTYLHCMT